MKNARAAGLQVKGENEREHCNILHCSSLSPSSPVPACATGSPGLGSDQTRPDRLAQHASPFWAAGRRMLFATTLQFRPALRPLLWLVLNDGVYLLF